MRGRGLLFLVAGLYALGILVPAAVLAGILVASLEREREASFVKRILETRDAWEATNEAVSVVIAGARRQAPADPGGDLDVALRRLWGPTAPDHGLVRLEFADGRGEILIHPFERVPERGPTVEDGLLLTSSEFRAALLAEQRGDRVEAAGRLRLALNRAADAQESVAIRLALARVLMAGKEPEEAARVASAIDLEDARFDPRTRLRGLELVRRAARTLGRTNRDQALRNQALSLLGRHAHRLGYFEWAAALEAWADRVEDRRELSALRELYDRLALARMTLGSLRDGANLIWTRANDPAMVVAATAESSPSSALTFLPAAEVLARARVGGLDTYLARRGFALTETAVGGAEELRVDPLDRSVGIIDHAPVGESVWADPDSRLLLILAGLTLLGLLAGFGVTLWAVNKQARLARLRADFISSVSHELKTPLTSLLLFTDLLRSGRVTDAEKVGQYHDFMGEESAKLAHLVANILDFARLEEGRKTYSFTPIDLGEVLRHTAAMFTARAEAAGATIECGGRPVGDLHVRADRDALERVLANLLDNAIKYGTKDGGAIELGAERIGEEIHITVTDHGPGIPTAARRRVFSRFTRGDHHGPDAPPGSGLGLAIVADLVGAHGGRVTVADTEGGGTTVTVTLPRAAAPATEPPARQSDLPEEQA